MNFASGAVYTCHSDQIKRASPRQLLLLACACYHRVSALLNDPRLCAAVRAAEQYAEGQVSLADLSAASAEAQDVIHVLGDDEAKARAIPDQSRVIAATRVAAGVTTLHWPPSSAATVALNCTALGMKSWAKAMGWAAGPTAKKERAAHLRMVYDIFGNPFRPVAVDSAWLTPNVVDLARTIYEERAFERIPILADALMDAGCEDEAVLSHCRSEGPHVRGCWVVDLLLGKQ